MIAFGRQNRLAVMEIGSSRHFSVLILVMHFRGAGLLNDKGLAVFVIEPFDDVVSVRIILILDRAVSLPGRHRIPVDIRVALFHGLILALAAVVAIADLMVAVNAVGRLLVGVQIGFGRHLASVVRAHQHMIAEILDNHGLIVFVKIELLENAAGADIVGFDPAVSLIAQHPFLFRAVIGDFLFAVSGPEEDRLSAVSVLVPERGAVGIVVPVGRGRRGRVFVLDVGITVRSHDVLMVRAVPGVFPVLSFFIRPLIERILGLRIVSKTPVRRIVRGADHLVAGVLDLTVGIAVRTGHEVAVHIPVFVAVLRPAGILGKIRGCICRIRRIHQIAVGIIVPGFFVPLAVIGARLPGIPIRTGHIIAIHILVIALNDQASGVDLRVRLMVSADAVDRVSLGIKIRLLRLLTVGVVGIADNGIAEIVRHDRIPLRIDIPHLRDFAVAVVFLLREEVRGHLA